MAIQKTQGIVLKTLPFRSSSLIVTFFTRDFGKVRGLAKGVRQERELRGALFELFSHLDIVYYEKTRSDLHLISEAAILESYDPIRVRLETITYASYFCELVDELTEVHDPHGNIFDLLDFSFRYLASLPAPRMARLFEIKLLSEIGWLPMLDQCLVCHKPVLEDCFFSPRQGAVLCPVCAPSYSDVSRISRETLRVMRSFDEQNLETAIRIAYSKGTEDELEKMMSRFFQERLVRPLKSKAFFSKIAPAFLK